jgi:hypothetical protein
MFSDLQSRGLFGSAGAPAAVRRRPAPPGPQRGKRPRTDRHGARTRTPIASRYVLSDSRTLRPPPAV